MPTITPQTLQVAAEELFRRALDREPFWAGRGVDIDVQRDAYTDAYQIRLRSYVGQGVDLQAHYVMVSLEHRALLGSSTTEIADSIYQSIRHGLRQLQYAVEQAEQDQQRADVMDPMYPIAFPGTWDECPAPPPRLTVWERLDSDWLEIAA